MRSSHSALGSSGMWCWTCSVFSAITAASSLASGSLNMSEEQQHFQTNLKINFAGFSTIFSFLDDDQSTQFRPTKEPVDSDPNIHLLGSIWEDILVAVFPQNWKLEATAYHIVLNEYICQKGDSIDLMFDDHSGQTHVIRELQDKVQSSLPYSSFFEEPPIEKDSVTLKNLEAPSRFCHPTNCRDSSDIVIITFFKTCGASHCLFASSSGSSDGCPTGRAYLSLKLPPFIFWLNLDLVNLVLDFERKFDDFPGKCKAKTDTSSESLKEQANDRSTVSWISNQHRTSTSHQGGLVGSVFLPHGRIILCFPLSEDRGLRSCTSWNEFVSLDFSSPPNPMKLKPEVPAFVRENKPWKQDSPSPSHSIHLNVVNLDVYYITSLEGDDCGTELGSQKFCALRVVSREQNWLDLSN